MQSQHPLILQALQWAQTAERIEAPADSFCGTHDVMRARIDRMTRARLQSGVPENHAWLLDGILSEIGNNSFDHNIGNWPDVSGIFFAFDLISSPNVCVLADRGRGIKVTISNIRPDVSDDLAALRIAFLERISGRAPEKRGNGLKFVRSSILDDGIDLKFQSGLAQYSIESRKESWGTVDTPVRGCLAILSWHS